MRRTSPAWLHSPWAVSLMTFAFGGHAADLRRSSAAQPWRGEEFCEARGPESCVGSSAFLQESSSSPFNAIHVGGMASPVVVDWDGDGDLDVVVGGPSSELQYFEQLSSGVLVERIGPGSNPFHGIHCIGSKSTRPMVVDFDGDGDLDLFIVDYGGEGGGEWGFVRLRYFERLSNGHLAERSDAASNPFYGVQFGQRLQTQPTLADWDNDGDLDLLIGSGWRGFLTYFEHLSNGFAEGIIASSDRFYGINLGLAISPTAVDWDGDGDSDLIIGDQDGKLKYFEQLSSGGFVERIGAGINPFHGIDVISYSVPAVVDFDGDGDLDLIVGTGGGQLKHFERMSSKGLSDQNSAASNPFHALDVGESTAPFPVDWDGDGDLDLVLANFEDHEDGFWGRLKYFERLSNGGLVDRIDAVSNPFFGIDVGLSARPIVIDFDGDGDLDLIVTNDEEPTPRYFERLSNGSFAERNDTFQNPFYGIDLGGQAVLSVVDWDRDGDLDVIIGGEIPLRYYERLSNGGLARRSGAGVNPFHDLNTIDNARVNSNWSAPTVLDWDGDGDLDLIVGGFSGSIKYFEQLSGGDLVERIGANNPFDDIHVGTMAVPQVVDWEDDGVLDVIIGNDFGPLKYFKRNFCVMDHACSSGGVCDIIAGKCKCLYGHSGSDCSSCLPNFYRIGQRYPPQCVSCAGNTSCANRGKCFDDLTARSNPALSNTGAMLAIGNGSCACTDEAFGGVDEQGRTTCADGACPAGSEEKPSFDGLHYCEPCSSGSYKADGMESCELCPPGQFAPDRGAEQCSPCPPGEFTVTRGNKQCSRCESGFVPRANQAGCEMCESGTFAVPGNETCTACQEGQVSESAGSMQCHHCPHGLVPNVDQNGCSACEVGTFANPDSHTCTNCTWGFVSPRGSTSCNLDYVLLCVGLGCLIAQFVALALVLLRARMSHCITDVTQCGDQAIVTTLQPHGITDRPGCSVRVQVSGTGHPLLDGSFRIRGLDANRLELLTAEGKSISEDVATSMGRLRHPPLREFVDRRPWVSALSTALLPVPWCTLALCRTLLADRPEFEQESAVEALGLAIGVGSVLAMVVAAIVRRLWAMKATPLERRQAVFLQRLHAQNPAPASCERGPTRAVRINQLVDLFQAFQDLIQMRTAYYLEANIIRPLTRPVQLSYAELAGPSTLNFFASHYWGTPFAHFVQALKQHAMTTGIADWGKLSYWICFLSNNQWKVADEMGGDDVKNSSFYKALCSNTCEATCMVLDSKALPLTRSWCLLEVAQTYRLKKEDSGDARFQGLLFCTGDGVIGRAAHGCLDVSVALAERLVDLSVRDARASKPEDHDKIMRLVEAEGGVERMDGFIRDSLKDTLMRVQTRFTSDMQVLLGRLGGS